MESAAPRHRRTHHKQFPAYEPVARAFRRADQPAAAQFLDYPIAALPFPVTDLQLEGGSEFMAAFEETCHAKGVDLCVLPPKSPGLNGVERANAAWRYEFYACYDLPHQLDPMNELIDSFNRSTTTIDPTAPRGGSLRPAISNP